MKLVQTGLWQQWLSAAQHSSIVLVHSALNALNAFTPASLSFQSSYGARYLAILISKKRLHNTGVSTFKGEMCWPTNTLCAHGTVMKSKFFPLKFSKSITSEREIRNEAVIIPVFIFFPFNQSSIQASPFPVHSQFNYLSLENTFQKALQY